MVKLKKILNEIKVNEAIPTFTSLAKAFDYIQGKRGESMDLEQTLRSTLADIQDLQRDMEQEAEPGGGPVSDRYGSLMMKQEKEYKILKAKKAKVDAQIDRYQSL